MFCRERAPQGDQKNCVVRVMNVSTGLVTTIAGSPQSCGYRDGVGPNAAFSFPWSVAVDPAGTIAAVVDNGNDRIRVVALAPPSSTALPSQTASPTPPPGSATVTTVAGSSVGGSADGTASVASFYWPTGVAVCPNATCLVVVSAAADSASIM